jgi:hypothetical protein
LAVEDFVVVLLFVVAVVVAAAPAVVVKRIKAAPATARFIPTIVFALLVIGVGGEAPGAPPRFEPTF